MKGAPQTAKDQLVCLWGAPSPVYKGVEEGRAGLLWRAPRGIPTPSRSRFPPFPSWSRRRRKGKGREGKRGGAAPSLVQFGLAMGGARPPLEALLSFPVWPIKAHYFPR